MFIKKKMTQQKKINRSVKLSDAFYETAKFNAELRHRSIAAQIEYWANLGIILEKKFKDNEIESFLLELRLSKNQ
jgi:hypothetical protein